MLPFYNAVCGGSTDGVLPCYQVCSGSGDGVLPCYKFIMQCAVGLLAACYRVTML